MSRTSLLPCPACSRHVRTNETECPFCAVALIGTRGDAPTSLPRPPKGASRAARFAFQTALLASSACTSTHEARDPSGRPAKDAVQNALPDAAVAVAEAGRGAPAMDAGRFDNSDTPTPPPRQSEVADEPERDDDGGFVVAIYGAPFPDPKSRAKV